MKKFLITLSLLAWGSISFAATSLTIGDALTLYFSELFPRNEQEAEDIVLRFSDIGNRPGLYNALQKGIYYGMIPNIAGDINPSDSITDTIFAALLKKHFGVEITTDSSFLTNRDFEQMMQKIRWTYSYALLQDLNRRGAVTTDNQKPLTYLSQASNYYILNEVYSILRNQHFENRSFSDEQLIAWAAAGLAYGTGDPYTQYFDANESTQFKNALAGKTAGIGVVLGIDTPQSLVVESIIPNSPAEKYGIKSGDRILKIDDTFVDTKNGIEDELDAIRWEEDTEVKLTIAVDRTLQTIVLARKIIQIPLIAETLNQKWYVITYREVGIGTDSTFWNALKNFVNSGKKRLIIDLRNNPGWSMLETRSILNLFIEEGAPLMILKYPSTEEVFHASLPSLTDWSKYEIIILVNGRTASAWEIIAAVLREYFPNNLRIVGETTYGKWVVQELVQFDDRSLLKYTVAEWLTPKNKTSINIRGIKPDFSIELDPLKLRTDGIDTQLEAAYMYKF